MHISVSCCFVSGRCISLFGYTLLLAVNRTICLVVTCEGGNLSLSYNPLPSQNPRSPGMCPLCLTTLNKKNHPIEVTLGGIGSSYASFTILHPFFILTTNCAITKPHRCFGKLSLYKTYCISKICHKCDLSLLLA